MWDKYLDSIVEINIARGERSAQRVPEPDPLPGIYFDTRPDPVQF